MADVLKAYSLYVDFFSTGIMEFINASSFSYDPLVGYCQGLPFIVAILLLNVSFLFEVSFPNLIYIYQSDA